MLAPEFEKVRLKLSDGSVDVGGVRYVFTSPEVDPRPNLRKRYGELPAGPKASDVHSPVDLADWAMQMARKAMVRDGYHGWYIMLFKGKSLVSIESLMARDRPDKIVLMSKLASVIERSGIDGFIQIGDMWTSPMSVDQEGFTVPPEFNPDRAEAIGVTAEDAAGRKRYLSWTYERKGNRIRFVGDQPVDMTDGLEPYHLQAIYQAWKRMGLRGGESTL